eukprot:108817_1
MNRDHGHMNAAPRIPIFVMEPDDPNRIMTKWMNMKQFTQEPRVWTVSTAATITSNNGNTTITTHKTHRKRRTNSIRSNFRHSRHSEHHCSQTPSQSCSQKSAIVSVYWKSSNE